MKLIRKITAIALLAVMILSCVCCGQAGGDEETEKVYETFEIAIREVNKRGNVTLETSFDALKEKNIEIADIITVGIGDKTYDMPVGTSYSDVDTDCMFCRFDTEDSKVVLAVNGGSFAEAANVAVKETIDEDPGYRWNMNVEKVTFTLKTKGGYQDEYTIRSLERTNDRADYSNLSDADFANCREITCGNIKKNTLYRGTTPLDDDMGRNTYTMAFITENGIKTVINLADSVDEMKAFATYEGSYYASCKIWNAEMDYKYTSEAFGEKVKNCIKFMLENDGPYYIHCKEGKDRTGTFCAVLECYLGATYEEVKDDYMLTYINFYHVEKGSDTYNKILTTNLEKTLCGMFDVTDLSKANLQDEAKAYLLSTGLTESELASLTAKLSTAD